MTALSRLLAAFVPLGVTLWLAAQLFIVWPGSIDGPLAATYQTFPRNSALALAFTSSAWVLIVIVCALIGQRRLGTSGMRRLDRPFSPYRTVRVAVTAASITAVVSLLPSAAMDIALSRVVPIERISRDNSGVLWAAAVGGVLLVVSGAAFVFDRWMPRASAQPSQ